MKEVQNVRTAKTPAREQILAVGMTGSGKTTAFRTLPGKKFMYLFDPNARRALMEPKPSDIDFLEFIPDTADIDISTKTLKRDHGDRSIRRGDIEPKSYREWEEDFIARNDQGFFAEYDWVGFDSFTTFLEIVMDRVQFLNGRLGKQPEQADWSAQIETVKNCWRAILGSGANVFATAHVETRKDDVVGRTYGHIMLSGRLRQRLPLMFAHVLGFHSDSSREGVRYMMQTAPDRQNPIIRTAIPNLKQFEDVTIDWNKPVEGQGVGRYFPPKKEEK